MSLGQCSKTGAKVRTPVVTKIFSDAGFSGRQIVILALGAITALFASTNASLAATSNDREWQFKLHHVAYGDCQVSLARHSFKMISSRGVTQLASAPKWQVVRYNLADKVEWRAKISQISGLNLSRATFFTKDPYLDDQHLSKNRWQKTGTATRGGMVCSKWIRKTEPNRIFFLSDEIQVDPEVSELLCRTFQLPITPGIPICVENMTPPKSSRNTDAGKKINWSLSGDLAALHPKLSLEMEAKSVRSVAFNKSDFAEPKGCRQVQKSDDVVMDSRQSNEFIEMLSGAGDSSREGESSKQHAAKNGH